MGCIREYFNCSFQQMHGKKQIIHLFRSLWCISCLLHNLYRYLKLLGWSHRLSLIELILYGDVICGNTVLGTVSVSRFILKLKVLWRWLRKLMIQPISISSRNWRNHWSIQIKYSYHSSMKGLCSSQFYAYAYLSEQVMISLLWLTRWVFYKRKELLTIRDLVVPRFWFFLLFFFFQSVTFFPLPLARPHLIWKSLTRDYNYLPIRVYPLFCYVCLFFCQTL